MMNILAAVHCAKYFSFAVNISEINPTDHKSITAPHFPQDNNRVQAEFSIWLNYGPSKRHHRVHDLENMNDFFERVWDYQAKNTTL